MPWLLKLRRTVLMLLMTCSCVAVLPNFAWAVNEKNTLDLNDIKASTELIKDHPMQQALMQQIQYLIRHRHLANLWQESQRNPNFKRGALNIAQFFRDLEKCQLYQNARDNTTMQADPKRQSDFYVLGGNFGVFNQEAIENGTGEGIVGLSIHVCAGAAGYQDQNYQLTLALFTDESSLDPRNKDSVRHLDMNKLYPQDDESLYRRTPQDLKVDKADRPSSARDDLKIEKGIKSEEKTNREQKLIIQKKGGSFTGVGGGGNVYALMVKAEMMTHMLKVTENFELEPLCEREWKDPMEFAKDVQELNLESKEGIKDIQYFKENGNTIIVPAMPGKFKIMYRITAKLAIFYLCKLKANVP